MTLPLRQNDKRSVSSSEEATTADDEGRKEPVLPLRATMTPAATTTLPPPPPPLPPLLLLPHAACFPPSALRVRDEGNVAMRAGDFSAAVVSYSRALLSLLESENKGSDERKNEEVEEERRNTRLARALVLSNRAAARLSLRQFSKAAADSLEAIELCRFWWRPWARLARARAGAGDARGAVRACREGEASAAAASLSSSLSPLSSSASSAAATQGLLLLPMRERVAARASLRAEADSIVLAAAHDGRFDGFDEAILEVRPAESGSEWLGLPAPPLKGETDSESSGDEEAAAPRICGSGESRGGGSGDAPAAAPCPPPKDDEKPKERRRPKSFRSLHDALAAAEDGDVIRMLPGTHNGLGRSAVIDKRVLIDGRGGGGGGGSVGGGSGAASFPLLLSTATAATLDARGNVPALRFRRPAAVLGLFIDATGFREAVRVDSTRGSGGGSGGGKGNATTRALLAGCSVTSSGDDGAVAAGSFAALTLLDCEIKAGRAGVRAFAGGDVELRGCTVEGCGTHGLAAQALSPSSPFLASGSPGTLGGRISAKDCRVASCREEGALCSGRGSSLLLEGVEIEHCRGPAVDASGEGCSVLLRGGARVSKCSGGGLWLWRGARGAVSPGEGGGRCLLSCEETFALLTDGEGTKLTIERGCCEVRGGVKGAESEAAAAAAAAASSPLSSPFSSSSSSSGAGGEGEAGDGDENGNAASTAKQQLRHCGPPPEVGPFRWDGPDPLRAE